ncbi:MAG: DUF389 domain-containing protein [Myxococcales bacterium]|nr:DUF389 domain-containing protein [Myxococcales bacterium]
MSDRRDQLDQPDKSDRPDGDPPGKSDQPDKSDRPGKSGRPDSDRPRRAARAVRGVRSLIEQLEDQAAGFIGVTPDDRISVVEGMLRRSTAHAIGYWLQLILAMAIATLGLAMNSVAVVIGAMLISPLMGPLIEFGVGLATGSLLLTIRAGVRTAASVAVVVFAAAGLTRLLPFHEVTTELAGRTSPTMIDLFIAVACALAAVYTTVREGKDAMAAAAGTAIGIALVPPLCTAGYGLGTGNHDMLQGALLLFTANFAAITAVTSATVLLLGFGQVNTAEIEDDVLERPSEGRLAHVAARVTRRTVGRRLGALTRLLLPAMLLGAILVPLRRALHEVSWQVEVRSEVERLLAEVPGAVVRQSLEVRAGTVRVRLFLVGTDAEARAVAATLRTKIAMRLGKEPLVDVVAVPDAATLDAMANQLRQAALPPPDAPAPAPITPPATLFASALDDALAHHWPSSAGTVLRLRVTPRGGTPVALELDVTHLGAPLGEVGEQLLEQAWSAQLEATVDVNDHPLPVAAVAAPADAGETWLPEAVRVLDATAGIAGLSLCFTVPAPAPPPPARPWRAPTPPPPPASIEIVRGVLTGLTRARPDAVIVDGVGWSVRVTTASCLPAPTAPADPTAPVPAADPTAPAPAPPPTQPASAPAPAPAASAPAAPTTAAP